MDTGRIVFGMPTLIENTDIYENIALCGKLGLDFVELNMNFPEYTIRRLEAYPLLDAARAAGIFFTVHLDETMNIADFNPIVANAYMETAERTIILAAAIGAPIVNMHMNHGIHITLPDRKVYMYDRNSDEYMASFARFRDMCELAVRDSGVKISIENTDGFTGFEKNSVEYLLKSPVFSLTWDIGHSIVAGERDVPFIMSHADKLAHFHIHDGRGTPPANHLALGDGEIDIENRLACAREHGCRCVLETKTTAALAASVEWLRNHGYMQ